MNWEYLAGLFDGEGYIDLASNGKNQWGLRLILCSCNFEVINKLYKQFKGSICAKVKYKNQHRDCWAWRLSGQNAKNFLKNIFPYSIIKREEIKISLLYPIGKRGKKVSEKDMALRIEIRNELQRLRRINYKEVY